MPQLPARPDAVSALFSRRLATLVGLGLASGLPYLLTSRTLGVWARTKGVDLTTIGLFSLVTLPYSYKFLWAPLMDRVSPLPGLAGQVLGRRRGWLVVTQVLLAGAIAMMALTGPTGPTDSLRLFAAAALLVAFFSASQDIVADAYRTDVLDPGAPGEVGWGASLFTSAYRVALLTAGAGAIFLTHWWPWSTVYLVLAGLMLLGVGVTLLAPNPPARVPPPRTLAQAALDPLVAAIVARLRVIRVPGVVTLAMIDPLVAFFRRHGPRGLALLGFMFLFKVPDYMAQKMSDPMLLDLGFDQAQVGLWSLGVGTAITIPGALLGGPLIARLGLVRALVVFGVAHILSCGGYLLLAVVGKSTPLMVAAVGVEWFCMGLVAAGYMAFLMSCCDQRHTATQYALFTGLMGLSASASGAAAGWLAQHLGYRHFFILAMVSGLPAMGLLWWVREPAGEAEAASA